MRKKLLATLLVLMMVVSIVPLTASAAECTEHNFVDAQTYYGWANYTTHVCTICGLEEAHIDANSDCICDACGFSIRHTDADLDCICDVCGGKYHSDWVLCSDENGHWRSCAICGDVFDSTYGQHYDTGTFTYEYIWTGSSFEYAVGYENASDGICDVPECGHGCNHTKTAIATGDEGSIKYCVSCLTILTTTSETITCTKHTFVSDGDNSHTCTICGYSEEHIDADEDCICDVCGDDCHGAWTSGYDEEFHYLACKKCGEISVRYLHTDENSDGKCDSCGYEMSSTATNPEPSTDPTTEPATEPTTGSGDDSDLDDVPKTGDSSLILVGVALLLVALPILKKFAF